ncbi:hypothetical protein ACNQGP_00645 [Flavobacterium sp. GT2N3]|uniref:hypothetical protein n=1 Tax=unclassified Flavobacterium TaxID=196869 RepID=UPI003AAC7234
MANLKNVKALVKILANALELSEQIREELDSKKDWLDEKSDKYKESEKGEEWEYYLTEVENLLDNLDQIELESFEE